MNKNKLYVLISILSVFLIIGCNKSANYSFKNENVFLDSLIDEKLNLFKRYDSINYSKNLLYKKAISIRSKGDRLIGLLYENNASIDSVKDFYQLLQFPKGINVYTTSAENLISFNANYAVREIKTYQYVSINILFDLYRSHFLSMEIIKPMIFHKKKDYTIGDSVELEIYLAMNNFTNKYIVVLNNDTIKHYQSNYPTYNLRCKKIGTHHLNGEILFFHAETGEIIKYPISTKYFVK